MQEFDEEFMDICPVWICEFLLNVLEKNSVPLLCRLHAFVIFV